MTHKQRKWIQETKSRPLRAGQTFSSRNTSIKQDYDGRRGHKGWRQDAADKRSEGSRRGQADNPWIPRRSGHIYMGPSPLCGTLSYKHSPHWISSPPMEESTNTTAWTSSSPATPSMTSPSTVSTGSPHVIRGVLPRTTTSAGTQDRVLSVDVLSRVVWSFVWTVKTEYTLYSSKYLRYSCKFKQT